MRVPVTNATANSPVNSTTNSAPSSYIENINSPAQAKNISINISDNPKFHFTPHNNQVMDSDCLCTDKPLELDNTGNLEKTMESLINSLSEKLAKMLQSIKESIKESTQNKENSPVSTQNNQPTTSFPINPSVSINNQNHGPLNSINPSVKSVGTPQSNSTPTPSVKSTNGNQQIIRPTYNSYSSQNQINTSRNGFLWKPQSENDGKLVVLLPPQLTGKVQSASIHSSLPPDSNNQIEGGRFSGDTHNGGRSHFRFSKSGASYPDNAYVVAQLKDGTFTSFQIKNSGSRNT